MQDNIERVLTDILLIFLISTLLCSILISILYFAKIPIHHHIHIWNVVNVTGFLSCIISLLLVNFYFNLQKPS